MGDKIQFTAKIKSLPIQGARIEIPMFEKIKLINHIAPHERSEN